MICVVHIGKYFNALKKYNMIIHNYSIIQLFHTVNNKCEPGQDGYGV